MYNVRIWYNCTRRWFGLTLYSLYTSLLRWQYGVRMATVRTVVLERTSDNKASKRRRIVLLAVVRYHNVATNDGQDGPIDAPTMILRR
jgi:hypothetical protein